MGGKSEGFGKYWGIRLSSNIGLNLLFFYPNNYFNILFPKLKIREWILSDSAEIYNNHQQPTHCVSEEKWIYILNVIVRSFSTKNIKILNGVAYLQLEKEFSILYIFAFFFSLQTIKFNSKEILLLRI